MTVGGFCPLDGLTVGEARIRETTGANVLGIKRGEDVLISPEPATTLSAGDVLVALGTREQLRALAEMVHSPESI
jgi:K+/H+ antiporter YhaU regulatory subunit KhtT